MELVPKSFYLRRLPKATPEKHSGVQVTIQGKSLNLKFAIQQMRVGSIEEQLGAFYEKDGQVVPDFGRMSKVERMVELNKYKEEVSKAKLDLQKFAEAKQKKMHELEVQNKVNEQLKKQQDDSQNKGGSPK